MQDDGHELPRAGAEIRRLTGARLVRNAPLLDRALRYWSSLRSGSALPRREALDPRAMDSIAAHSMILDRVRPGTIRVRHGGRTICDVIGMEVRGLPIRALFGLEDRLSAVALIEACFEQPAILQMELVSADDGGRSRASLLVLPLLDHAGAVTKALCTLSTDTLALDRPLRFAMVSYLIEPVGMPGAASPSTARPDPTRFPAPRDPASLPMELAEPKAEFVPAPKAPWLRVVK